MSSKSRNEDKDNIDQNIDVCAMGVQTIMQSDHSMQRVQPKPKVFRCFNHRALIQVTAFET